MGLDWQVFLQPASGSETYLDWLLAGLRMTVALGLGAIVIALPLGTVLGVMRHLPNRFTRAVGTAYVEVFRNIPLIVQLFLWYYAAPELLPADWRASLYQGDPVVLQYAAATLGLGVFTAARVCEQVRAGLISLSRGQTQAGLALGLTLAQTYRHVLLPVAMRVVVPPLTSEALNVFKNSAVASTIGLLDLAAQGRQLVDYTARSYESFLAVTLLYMLLNFLVMLLMRRVEARTRLPGSFGEK